MIQIPAPLALIIAILITTPQLSLMILITVLAMSLIIVAKDNAIKEIKENGQLS